MTTPAPFSKLMAAEPCRLVRGHPCVVEPGNWVLHEAALHIAPRPLERQCRVATALRPGRDRPRLQLTIDVQVDMLVEEAHQSGPAG
jgi:hypothetical protein